MNYLKVPDSNVKLVDGSVVILHRFPGTKWVVHNGWYEYAGRRCSGWYFCSIPAQTIIPVSNQDLQLITVVAQGSGDAGVPNPPADGCGCEGPGFPPPPPPGVPPGTVLPGPGGCCPPPRPPIPPMPPSGKLAVFTKEKDEQLSAAFTSVPTLKQRDEMDTEELPDGKLVRVNSVDGVSRYYKWSKYNDRWEEVSIENSEEQLLENYYNKEEIDAQLEGVQSAIDATNATLNELAEDIAAGDQQVRDDVAEGLAHLRDEITAQLHEASTKIAQLRTDLANEQAVVHSDIQAVVDSVTNVTNQLNDLKDKQAADKAELSAITQNLSDRLVDVEAAVTEIGLIRNLTAENTVIVYDGGTMKRTEVSIGDDEIGEPSTWASSKVVATEKAVARLVETSTPHWRDI